MFNCSYNQDADILNLKISGGSDGVDFVRSIFSGYTVDTDKTGRPLEINIFEASKKYSNEILLGYSNQHYKWLDIYFPDCGAEI